MKDLTRTQILELIVVAGILVWLAAGGMGVLNADLTQDVREMFSYSFIIPILVSAFFFGQTGGLLTALAASLITGALVVGQPESLRSYHIQRILFQIFYFNTVALVTSALSDRERTAQQRLRYLFERVPVGIYRATPAGGILVANPGLANMLGYAHREELTGKNIADFSPVQDERQVFLDALAGQQNLVDFETQLQRSDGTVFWVRESVRASRDEKGGPLYYEGVVQDISESKAATEALLELNAELEQRVQERTAQLQAANKELEAFSYSVSHDLRAPLRSVDGFGQALLEDFSDQLEEEGQEYLRRIRSATQRMGELIDDMLRLARITRSEMTLEPVHLSELAQSTANMLAAADPTRQVRFSAAPGVEVRADANLMRIVMENLLENAWKFTGRQEEAEVEFGVTQRNGQTVYYVRDNGAGFDMAFADKLFGAFQRLHSPNDFDGTGIGLATVQRVIHRHGGEVWADGEVGKGATFFFTL